MAEGKPELSGSVPVSVTAERLRVSDDTVRRLIEDG